MELRLEVVKGPDRGTTLVFDATAPFVFGRAGPPDRDLALLTDASVSRKHVYLSFDGNRLRITPVTPTSGLWVGGDAVEEVTLDRGRSFQIGRTTLRATWEGVDGAAHDVQATGLRRRQLSDFALGDELGRGSFGRVVEAVDRSSGEPVAIKLFSPDTRILAEADGDTHALREKAMQFFLRELDLVARLEHPNIVRALALGRNAEEMFLAMELVRGATLDEVVATHGRLSVAEMLAVAADTLDALRYAHERGVMHRDVSPRNIMLTGAPGAYCAKLLDFGLAKRREGAGQALALTATGDVRGNLGFISPECLRDAKRSDLRTDIFSLGATLVYGLCSRYWFGRELGIAAVDRILAGHGVPIEEDRPDVPVSVQVWIDRALAPDPDHRYQTAVAMRQAMPV